MGLINLDYIREISILELNKLNLYKSESTNLRYDFYIPKYNTIIEYDGIQHFKPVNRFGGENYLIKLNENDGIKNEYCHRNDIKLLRISYDNINILENIIQNYLTRSENFF